MTHTITFFPDGTACTLNTEAVPLHQLGTLTIRRASSVEFNNARQLWEVRLKLGPLAQNDEVSFSHQSRQACIDWEREFFEGVGAAMLKEIPFKSQTTTL